MADKDLQKLIGEELKDEIYRITELAIVERFKEYEKRISDLEMLKAELIETQNELKADMAELKRLMDKQKIGSAEQLGEINKRLAEINGQLKSVSKLISEKLEKKKDKK
ncbi:MAG: hypothetical protein ACPL06_02690 [Candidatus Anstonellales archaeon]